MRVEVCVSECGNTSCRWNEKNCKASEGSRFLAYMRNQLRCEGYVPQKPEKSAKAKTAKKKAKGSKNDSKNNKGTAKRASPDKGVSKQVGRRKPGTGA